ncbi:hypothetical protein [Ornithinimicrobium sp. INDO-MA30-4]|uniref:hypothetical protein n=1 Tax=Ornithinimicrobium sp. INDO-MA30-4 TaxID=2908651 RepID=UPI001F39F7AC|nr:hypothetical protein [Ornithinimicrobium sp. INDO-MA30-4]UJH70682.1 hypothetical protein L0A91_00910 [Ornithinimicrobium sp. INDO-MA30-4]
MSDECCGSVADDSPASEVAPARPLWWRDSALLPSAISGIFLVAGWLLGWGGLDSVALAAHTIALLVGAATFVPMALKLLIRGKVGVGFLMTLAAVGAVLLGHVGEAAALASLFSGRSSGGSSHGPGQEGLRALLSLIPQTARVVKNGRDSVVAVADIRQLDVLRVGAGERLATDGVVLEGRSAWTPHRSRESPFRLMWALGQRCQRVPSTGRARCWCKREPMATTTR